MQIGNNQTQFRNNLAFLLKDRRKSDKNKIRTNIDNITF